MKSNSLFGVAVATAASAAATAAFAGDLPVAAAPAPLMAAGLPGLAILAVAGGGYLAMRLRRRDRD